MEIRFYIHPETGAPHIHAHAISEEEVEDVLAKPLEDRRGYDNARVAIGRTRSGRYLKVVYAPDPEPDSVFVVTAYPLGPKALKALRRRKRRRT